MMPALCQFQEATPSLTGRGPASIMFQSSLRILKYNECVVRQICSGIPKECPNIFQKNSFNFFTVGAPASKPARRTVFDMLYDEHFFCHWTSDKRFGGNSGGILYRISARIFLDGPNPLWRPFKKSLLQENISNKCLCVSAGHWKIMILVTKWVAVARHGLKLWENDARRLICIFRPTLDQTINLKIGKKL